MYSRVEDIFVHVISEGFNVLKAFVKVFSVCWWYPIRDVPDHSDCTACSHSWEDVSDVLSVSVVLTFIPVCYNVVSYVGTIHDEYIG